MSDKQQPNNPLHGKTLEMILNALVDKYGWTEWATGSESIVSWIIQASVPA